MIALSIVTAAVLSSWWKNCTIFGIALELMHVTANLTGCPEVSFIE